MSEEHEHATEAEHPAATANNESDDYVTSRFSVAVIPGESVSSHFTVTPKDPKNAVTSVTLSFVQQHEGVVIHSFAGSTVQEAVEPRDGQGAMGDSGVDVAVFNGRDQDGDLFSVLAGTVRTEDGPRSFFFRRPFFL